MVDEATSIYQIFVRNFTPEGTFNAAARRLAGVRAMGFDWVYLTPVQPIGQEGRKGSLGSPYAISDYRTINLDLGTMEDFEAFINDAHGLGLKVMLDVVYNHTSPDSVLARERPEWFLHDSKGALARKCADWSDVVDLDYGSSPELWIELIDTLAQWRKAGIDGFRCDVASLVPADFWRQARQRINLRDPGTKADTYPILWLAESMHPHFLKAIRDLGYGAWSESELHTAAFDLTYDYDGWEKLEPVWKGERPASYYLEYLFVQETTCPKGARKIRCLENHDQERAASRFPERASLKAWTLLSQFIPGVTFAYMGQEYAIAHKPDLFGQDPVDWSSGDREFHDFFCTVLKGTKQAKQTAPFFAWRNLGRNCLLLERFSVAPRISGPAAELAHSEFARPETAGRLAFEDESLVACALVNLDGSDAEIDLPERLEGFDVLSQSNVCLKGHVVVPREPLLITRA
ncbi:MAG: hypothetical protein LLF89_04990 [Spirochaetaceae bacterium]|nr:hypothetical protein [Spirochaetaceae bacterium]